jgi:ATP-binding cassette, subfamily B, bacterial
MLLVGFLLLVSKLIAAAFPLGLKFITDYALIPRDLVALGVILAVLAAAELISATTDIGRDYFYSRFSAKILNDLRFDMFRHLQRLSMRFYGRTSTGEITSRFTTDLAAVDNAITVCLQPVVCQIVMISFCLMFLFALEWKLALLATAGLALSLRGERLVEPKADVAGVMMKTQQAKIASELQENVQAQPVVKMFCLQSLLIERFKHHMIDFYRTAARACFLGYLTSRVPSRLISFCSLLVLASGSLLVYADSLTLGELVAFQILIGELDAAVAELSWGLPQLLQAGAGMQRIGDLLDEPVDVVDAADATTMPVPEKDIVLANVCFGYAADALNLKEVSLRIPVRQSVLLVGPSGCGKSTVLNLLMRFYDPLSGSVAIDGRSLQSVTQESLRKHMSVVLQESFLFNTTIRENIQFANPEATEADIVAAAKAAEIHDVIIKMPDGYGTVVGERGGKLSGGQRQRIAIARAILSRPSILLLDEATSALDPVSAASINRSLERLGKGRTVISVTHRLEGAPAADRIYVFQEGRLSEEGRHEQLLANNGLYAQLWQKQTGFTLSEDGSEAHVESTRLRHLPALAKLDDASLAQVSGLFATEHFESQRFVVQQGDPGDKFYIIVRGRAAVTQTSGQGDERQLEVLEDGDYFGEIALLKRIPRTASVRTLSPCIFLSLQREHFLRLVAANRLLREELEKIAVSRPRPPLPTRTASPTTV